MPLKWRKRRETLPYGRRVAIGGAASADEREAAAQCIFIAETQIDSKQRRKAAKDKAI